MKFFAKLFAVLLPISVWAQNLEHEPNDSKEQANPLSLVENSVISAQFNPSGDMDFFSMDWQKDCMYYLTSIENNSVAPNINLYFGSSSSNLLTTDVGGRNGNNNFRLSGFVPFFSAQYYAKIFDPNGAQGAYKIRLAGGRSRAQLIKHEPDNTISFVSALDYLAEADTVYGALYPENDIDYYKIRASAGYKYTIGTMPILDLQIRDTDTYITLYDSLGNVLKENDDRGNEETPSGSTNNTFSIMSGVFTYSGTCYVSVRSYYNTNFGQTISETNPPMGEYGLFYFTEVAGPSATCVRYPHIEIPTISSVIVQWVTYTPQPTHLLWGESNACTNSIFDSNPKVDHTVKINGLEPSTKYFYRVIIGTDSSACECFYTAKPASQKNVNFFVIGDSSPYAGFGSSPEQLQVAQQIQKVEYDFGLHAGDINQHIGEEYDLVFYQPYKDILKSAPIFTCIGNHDTYYDNAQTYLASFNLPYNNPDSTERYYSFNYGHAHFISLDTNIPYYPGSQQYEWLKQDLESEMRGETTWTFIYFHHPPWSEGWPGYPGEIGVRTYLVPLFEEYHVDMTFSGHTHDYERGFLNGVYYIITGGGGCTLEEGIQAYDYDHVTVWINQHHFTYIQLQEKTMQLQAINKDGERIDLLEYEKSTSGMENPHSEVPTQYALFQNFPNPFNLETKIGFILPEASAVTLNVQDIRGRTVRKLINEKYPAGQHEMGWNGKDDTGTVLPSGIYLANFKADKFSSSFKMLLVK